MGVQNKALAIIFITILLGQLSNAHRRESEEQADCAISYAAGAVGGACLLAAAGYGMRFIQVHRTVMVVGGIVAAAQSAGVVGLAATTKAAIVGTGAVVGYTAAGGCGSKCSDEKKGGR